MTRNLAIPLLGSWSTRGFQITAISCVLCACASQTSAALVFSATRAAFDAAYPGLPTETFEEARVGVGGAAATGSPLSSATNNAIFHTGEILPGVSISASLFGSPDMLALNNLTGPTTKIVGNNADDELNLAFSPSVAAVAMNLFINWSTTLPVNVSIYGASGLLGTTAINATMSASGFLGVGSNSVPITSIRLQGGGTAVRQVWIDNVSFGGMIPEPGAGVLFVIGAITLAFSRRMFVRKT